MPVNRDVLLIGRALTTDIPLDDAHISRHHARLTRQEEQLIVEDLQTVNGTLVNDQSLTKPHALQPGDVISLGPFTIRVEQTVTPVPQSRPETSAYPIPPTKPQMNWILLIAAGIVGLILIGLLGLGLYWFATSDNLTVVEAPPGTATLDGPTITINQAPAESRLVSINQPVTVQATASDPSGVTRLELWVDGHKIDEVDTQLVQVPPSLNATLQWLPDIPGVYELEIRAYNPSGQTSIQRVTTLRVVGERNTPTPVPSATLSPTIVALLPTSIPPTPSPTPAPSLTSTAMPSPTPIPATPTPSLALLTLNLQALNVRTGPGLQYSQVGQLVQGNPVEIVGQANIGQGKWWQIRFTPAPGGLGWVSADANFTTASNADAVPLVDAPALASAPSPSTATLTPPTHTPVPTTTTVAPSNTVIRAPAGKTLLIVSNRSLRNEPALLTLSGGKSVGGGREIKAPAGSDVQIVLEPDFYRALWSSTAGSGGFARGADFTAVQDKVIVMWIVPEDGRTATESYDQLNGGAAAPAPAATATPAPVIGGYTAPPGKAIFVAANRSLNNSYAVVTLSGGSFGGGQEIKLDATAEIPLELLPGNYRAVWTSPAREGGFNAGREFKVSAGEVILSWIIPEEGQLFMQFPGQAPQQINN